MGFIDKLRRVGGIIKNRLASSVGALRGAAAGVTVRGARTVRGVKFAARGARLLTPAGLGLTAVSFAPEIVRGVRAAGRFIAPAIARGIAFFGGRQIVTAGGAGAVAGILVKRKSGGVSRPGDFGRPGDPRFQTFPRQPFAPRGGPALEIGPSGGPRKVGLKPGRTVRGRRPTRRGRRRRIPAHRHRVVSVPIRKGRRKRRTHARPRHRGHKRVSFTTSTGQKVSFLANPKARHR